MDKHNKLMKLNKEIAELSKEHWFEDVVFSFPWWFNIFTLIVPWIIWWVFVDRKRIKEIIIVGYFIMITSYLLDQVGASLILWTYKITTSPLARDVFDPADLTILPVLYMLIYQYCNGWKKYIFTQICFAFFAAYVGGNIFELLGIYVMIDWRHIYSVPIYILLGIFAKLIVSSLNKLEKREEKKC